ncbi:MULTISPECIES: anti-sigma factor family protein [unclassified Streptomyces]|uniref:anti-sigma factor family protein n=1 Tax=unclassified Streptomyces TaxID=2593676 RepID=UPI0036EB4561
MSGTVPTPAEQHLGDRLAALVDGELKHDARERVLAHLATCTKCKAEAAAQRRLKSVFAQSAPPSPSEGFLARLQGLPGGPGGDDDNRGKPFGGSGRFADGPFPVIQPSGSRSESPQDAPLGRFGFLPAPHGSTAVLPGGSARSGFRIHEVGREAERSPRRGRRFAFAAASAVSLAAIALGGALPTGAGSGPARAAGGGNAVNPLDATTRSESGTSASRRGGGSQGALGATEASDRSTAAAAPPSPVPEPATTAVAPAPTLLSTGNLAGNALAVHLLSNVSTPPLIRPTGTTPLFARVLGRLAAQPSESLPQPSSQPSWTPPPSASALPTPADRRLPLSAQR